MQVPPGWISSDIGLPDMVFYDEGYSKDYEGELWTAHRGEAKVEVRWMGNHAKYFCRVFLGPNDPENPTESRTFDYPHEIIEWLSMWFQNMGPLSNQPE